jgi:hypothetical protein
MIYLLAIIGLLALTYLAWRAFGPDAPAGQGQSNDRAPSRPGRSTRRGPVGPDDDPEFLNDLDRKARNKDPKFQADGDDKPSPTE